ncbi:MAG TPA: hypothetical protein VH083_01870, partial [Myxococcales bacterium]|nr:hypothetical protein [Myxococcales bacterium]
DVACNWPQSGGIIDTGQLPITDLFPDPNDASFALAVVVNGGGNAIIASHDGGKTFQGPLILPLDAIMTGIEISTTRPTVVYVTSSSLVNSDRNLWRSEDKGATWTSTLVPEEGTNEPRIMAIDPANSDIVYLRVIGALTDSIVITTDQGQSFNTVLSINGKFTGFLRATDGSLYAGSSVGKLYRRAPGETTFTEGPGPFFRCLGQRPGESRIYACGDFTTNGFSLGFSDDNGATFKPMMSFTDILGPLTCPTVATNCEAHWERIQGVLGIGGDDAGTTAPPDGGVAVPDAGNGNDGGGVSTPPPSSGKSGCSTAAADGLALMTLAALFLRSRRRRS